MLSDKLFILVFITFTVSCSPSSEGLHLSIDKVLKVNKSEIELNTKNGMMLYDGLPFTGCAIEHYDNDSIALSIDYKDGKKEGSYQKWYSSGLLSYEAAYVNGKKHGKARSWWQNGNLRSEANFENGVAHGEQFEFYASGSLFKKLTLEYGIEKGLQQSWRENGKLFNNYEMKNGRIYGLKRSKLCFKLDDENIL